MASKSKNVRMAQLKEFEKKLDLRIKYLTQKGVGQEKIQSDSIVKSLKSKTRETRARIAAIEKLVNQTEKLAKAKEQKIAELAKQKEEPKQTVAKESKEEKPGEEKPKKKAVKTDKEPKKESGEKEEKKPKEKKPAVDAEGSAPKKTKKKAGESGSEAPKKRTTKKKEE